MADGATISTGTGDGGGPSAVRHPPSAMLSARGLHKHFRLGGQDLHVLKGVDLDVAERQWVAILGRSGSGKSTLLHLLGGLDRPDGGRVVFQGTNLFELRGAALDHYRARRAGFVFQFYHLLPELTALENVLVAAMISRGVGRWVAERSDVRDRAVALLGRVGLGERLKHRPNKLSGGERQRVAIARALINNPAVLLADEPTGNLDADTGRSIIELFQGLHADGQTIVMVTHDDNVAAAADRQVTLTRGVIDAAVT